MEHNYNNELYHYGILGMKWGVRRNHTSGGIVESQRHRWEREQASKKRKDAIKDAVVSKVRNKFGIAEKKPSELSKTISTGKQFIDKLLEPVVVDKPKDQPWRGDSGKI